MANYSPYLISDIYQVYHNDASIEKYPKNGVVKSSVHDHFTSRMNQEKLPRASHERILFLGLLEILLVPRMLGLFCILLLLPGIVSNLYDIIMHMIK